MKGSAAFTNDLSEEVGEEGTQKSPIDRSQIRIAGYQAGTGSAADKPVKEKTD
jgi:hypothetical protein